MLRIPPFPHYLTFIHLSSSPYPLSLQTPVVPLRSSLSSLILPYPFISYRHHLRPYYLRTLPCYYLTHPLSHRSGPIGVPVFASDSCSSIYTLSRQPCTLDRSLLSTNTAALEHHCSSACGTAISSLPLLHSSSSFASSFF